MKIRSLILSAALSLAAIPSGAATVYSSVKTPLSDGWKFVRQDLGGVWEILRESQPGKPTEYPLWTDVTLPHCYNAEDSVDPDLNYYQGAGWYTRTLEVANPFKGGRTLLEFEGSGQVTDVWIDSKHVGSHTGGYDGWCVDITDALAGKKSVTLSVRCDNTRNFEIIPSQISDFTIAGGIYRPLNLVFMPSSYVNAFVIKPSLDAKNGYVDVEFTCTGVNGGKIAIDVLSPEGEVISTSNSPGRVASVKKPRLWSDKTPVLYACRVKWTDSEGNTQEFTENFGFRTQEFREHGPFFLNGERVLLKGTHIHEDFAGVGAALPDAVMRKQMQQMKDMGVNFVRLGHYQQSEMVLSLCDSLGIMVWEEIPWCRGGLGGDDYKEQARRMLRNMIAQHRNHTSVILWGMGNETDWPGDFEVFDAGAIHDFMGELTELSHSIDPSRPTCTRRNDKNFDVVDVYSPSIWDGWYSGKFFDYPKKDLAAIEKYPRFFHAEWGGDSHPHRHTEGKEFGNLERNDANGDWSETYIIHLFDWNLHKQAHMDNLTGSAFWTFRDFATPIRHDNPIPYMNQKGVLEHDGTPKESYYVFQSYWTEKPMAHIYGHTWPVRWGAPSDSHEVLVYSNCDRVELFLNGKSLGVKTRNVDDYPAAGFHWDVVFVPGNNSLKAVATKGKTVIEDEISQFYETRKWGAPAQVKFDVKPLGGDKYRVNILFTDASGVPCLDAANFVRFAFAGDGRLLDNMGTSHGSRRIQLANGRACIDVECKSSGTVSAYLEKEGIGGLVDIGR